jgi:predicted nucleic acid-binding protein
MNVVDSSGWIEHFQNSPRAAFFSDALLDKEQLLVPSIAVYEVHRRLSPWLPSDLMADCVNVMQSARILDLTTRRAIAASEAAQKHKLAMADAIMYSIAREFKATFWTQDVDYQGLPGVKYQART